MNKSIARTFAEYALSVNYSELPEAVKKSAKNVLFDSIGCALGGLNTRDAGILRSVMIHRGGRAESRLIGSGEALPRTSAALMNSLLIRTLDFNDIYWKEDPVHPSDLIGGCLSVAEAEGKSMTDVLSAIVLSYDLLCRMAEFAHPGLRERKWHHATLTQFVSPIVFGRLMDLDEERLLMAEGISGCHSYTSGSVAAGRLSMMKNFADPLAIEQGLFASELAKEGFTGSELVFEGKEALEDVLGDCWDNGILTEGLGTDYRILETSIKAFPTEALTHGPLSCCLKILNQQSIVPGEIQEVRVEVVARACDILFDSQKYRPESRETADHSLPYCISRAIIDRGLSRDSFSLQMIRDPRVLDLMHRIRGKASEEFEKIFPEKQPSRLSIVLKDGREYSEYLEYPKGHPKNPMTEEELQEKFSLLSSGIDISLANIREAFDHIEALSVRDFMDSLIINNGRKE